MKTKIEKFIEESLFDTLSDFEAGLKNLLLPESPKENYIYKLTSNSNGDGELAVWTRPTEEDEFIQLDFIWKKV